ncbi:MAG: pyridoxamine 5'-phosphate oxidase family protein [Alkalicoccus sp.]|nr:MAG: pyridoxamine 5'-phosphate oxidase family protein [Alkalicoccus sp.]
MKIIRDVGGGIDLEEVLAKPLVAHLATVEKDCPRDSPVWFIWENEKLWIIGTAADSFPERIQRNPNCAVGIVDFHSSTGQFIHIGFRGRAAVKQFNHSLAEKLIARYLGSDPATRDPRFQNLDDSNVLLCFTPETVVVRDQSYRLPSVH